MEDSNIMELMGEIKEMIKSDKEKQEEEKGESFYNPYAKYTKKDDNRTEEEYFREF